MAAIAAAPIITQKARCHNQTAFGKLYKESSVFCKISRPFQQKGTQPFPGRVPLSFWSFPGLGLYRQEQHLQPAAAGHVQASGRAVVEPIGLDVPAVCLPGVADRAVFTLAAANGAQHLVGVTSIMLPTPRGTRPTRAMSTRFPVRLEGSTPPPGPPSHRGAAAPSCAPARWKSHGPPAAIFP